MFYSNLVYGLVILFLSYKLVSSNLNIFQVLIFLIPFHSWIFNVGLNLTISQIATILMLAKAAIFARKNKKNLLYVGNGFIVIFFLFAMMDTLFVTFFMIDKFQQLGGFFRSEGRYIGQLALLFISFCIIPLSFNYVKDITDVQKYLKTYLHALIFLAILGWIQYFTYSLVNIDLFPLSINEFGDIRSGLHDIESTQFFRMSSLGGEPKGFSMSLVVGFFIIHIFNRYDIYFFKHDTVFKYLFLFTSFSTFSTSGMVLFTILLVIDMSYRLLKSKSSIKFDFKKILYSFIVIVFISSLITIYWNFISVVIEQKIFGRDVISEDYDAPIQIFLSNFPEYILLGSGLGNIHNLAYPYIPNEYLHYMGGNIFVAKSGYLRIISELGLTGFLLFIFMVHSVYRKTGIMAKQLNTDNCHVVHALQRLLLLSTIAYFSRVYMVNELFLFLAMANVITSSKIIRKKFAV